MLTLVLGGASSGKSRYAESLLADCPKAVYLATARLDLSLRDPLMAARIKAHRQRRDQSPTAWTTIEEPLRLVSALAAHRGQAALIDSLSLWLTNLLDSRLNPSAASDQLLEASRQHGAALVAVSAETGLGVLPAEPMSAQFREASGRLNQQLAAVAERVVLVVAGQPLILKAPQASS